MKFKRFKEPYGDFLSNSLLSAGVFLLGWGMAEFFIKKEANILMISLGIFSVCLSLLYYNYIFKRKK